MQKYDFDKVVDRRGTGALKLDVLQERYGRSDLLPLWVADMDFETPHFITEALQKRLQHSLYGYTVMPEGYWETIAAWIKDHHQWDVKPEWMKYVPGIVKGIGMAINVFVAKDEKVIIQPPVYHPFRITTEGNGREVVYNPLRETKDGRYEMDFDNLSRIADSKCKLLVMSNPHNPGGIVWDRETLTRLADFCYEHGIIVISDEIHCDMALFGHKHIPFATVSEKAKHCSITFGAPSKTFNIAGIISSYAIVPDDEIRARFYRWINANELDEPNLFAPIATMAAFKQGEEWRRQMLSYVEENILFVEKRIHDELPEIKVWRPEASFLVWMDCRGLNLKHEDLVHLFVDEAHLALNDGAMFGHGGSGFMRMNVGSPRSVINEAIDRLVSAVRKRIKK